MSVHSLATQVERICGEIPIVIFSGILFVDHVILCRGFREGDGWEEHAGSGSERHLIIKEL